MWDPWKTPLFAQFLRYVQISILEILNVFLWLKFSPSLNLNKNEHFSKVSMFRFQTELFETIFIILFHCKDQHIQIPWQDFSYPLVNRHQVPPIGLIGNPVKIGSGPAAVIPTLLEAISKLGFSVDIPRQRSAGQEREDEDQPAGILKYVEDLIRGLNADIRRKDFFEMTSIMKEPF